MYITGTVYTEKYIYISYRICTYIYVYGTVRHVQYVQIVQYSTCRSYGRVCTDRPVCTCVGTYVCRYLGPNIPNIFNILTNIGHHFSHQSGLDESSGRNDQFLKWFCIPRLFGQKTAESQLSQKKTMKAFVKSRAFQQKACCSLD